MTQALMSQKAPVDQISLAIADRPLAGRAADRSRTAERDKPGGMIESIRVDQAYSSIVDPGRSSEEMIWVANHLGAAILNAMPSAALLLDREAGIAHMNAAAEAILGEGEGLAVERVDRLQLTATLPAEAEALRHALMVALEVAARGGGEPSEPVRISRRSDVGPLLVVPVPLPRPAFALCELVDAARVLVLIVDPSSQPRGVGAALRKTFGLTAAEARVASLIGQGLTGPQAAIAIGVAAATVKTHLARCFDKIGVHSQVMLARVVNALPADQIESHYGSRYLHDQGKMNGRRPPSTITRVHAHAR